MTTRHSDKESPADAALLLTAIGRRDWDGAREILRENWTSLVATNLEDVRTALLAIPASEAESDPLLRAGREMFVGRGMTTKRLMTAVPADAEEIAEWGRATDVADRLAVGTAQAALLRYGDALAEAASLAGRLEQVAESALQCQPDAVVSMLPILRLQWGITCQLAGRHDLSNTIFRRSYFGAEYAALHFVLRNTAGSLALNFALSGELDLAHEWLERWKQTPPSPGRLEKMVRVSGLIASALVALEELDLRSAAEALDTLGELRDGEELWAYALYAHSQYALLSGAPSRGLDRLDRAGSVYARWRRPGSDADALITAAAVDLHCALGHGNAAFDTLHAHPGTHPLPTIARARFALLTDDPSATLVECARATAGGTLAARTRLEALLLESSAYMELDRVGDAIAAWREATELADATGSIRPFALLPPRHRSRLVAAGVTFPKTWRGRAAAAAGYPDRVEVVKLTERESMVLSEMAQGLNRFEIAAKLYVSPNTVKAQASSLFRKLGAHSRDEAVTTAAKLKLLQ